VRYRGDIRFGVRGIPSAKASVMRTSHYNPKLLRGMRVLFVGHHPKTGHHCTIIGALPNASGRSENQWYDVRFDDHSMSRVHERYLLRADSDGKETAA
jgi:hypothetical protein